MFWSRGGALYEFLCNHYALGVGHYALEVGHNVLGVEHNSSEMGHYATFGEY